MKTHCFNQYISKIEFMECNLARTNRFLYKVKIGEHTIPQITANHMFLSILDPLCQMTVIEGDFNYSIDSMEDCFNGNM